MPSVPTSTNTIRSPTTSPNQLNVPTTLPSNPYQQPSKTNLDAKVGTGTSGMQASVSLPTNIGPTLPMTGGPTTAGVSTILPSPNIPSGTSPSVPLAVGAALPTAAGPGLPTSPTSLQQGQPAQDQKLIQDASQIEIQIQKPGKPNSLHEI